MHIRTIARPVAVGLAVLAAGTLSALGGYEAHAHAATVDSAKQTRAALREYKRDLDPSDAWRKATHKERTHARRAYLHEFGSWENGCLADLEHAYQGRTGKAGLAHVQPHLPVYRQHVPGRDIYLGQFVPGVCG